MEESSWWLIALVVWLAINVPVVAWYDRPIVTFYQATAQCGHEPVIVSNFAACHTYTCQGTSATGRECSQISTSAEVDAKAAGYTNRALHNP